MARPPLTTAVTTLGRWMRVGWRTVAGLRTPAPRPGWTGRQHFAVRLLRALLDEVVDADVATQRRMLRKPAGRLPDGFAERRLTLGGRDAWEWTPPGADPTRRLLYFHGGGYVIGHPVEMRRQLCALARLTGVSAVAVRYRLAPEHPHPAAMEDGEAAVQALVDSGVPASGIVLVGDSAGGGIALGTLLRLRDRGGPRVAGAIAGSPMVEHATDADSYRVHADSDYLTAAIIRAWSALTSGDPADPSLSVRRADLTGLPPLRLLVGEAELFHDDVCALADAARAAGVDVTTLIGADAVHCWYADPILPGPTDTRDRIAAFAAELWSLAGA